MGRAGLAEAKQAAAVAALRRELVTAWQLQTCITLEVRRIYACVGIYIAQDLLFASVTHIYVGQYCLRWERGWHGMRGSRKAV